MREAVCSAWHELSEHLSWARVEEDPCKWSSAPKVCDMSVSGWPSAHKQLSVLREHLVKAHTVAYIVEKFLDSITGWSFPSCRYKHILIFWLMEGLTALCLDSSKISFFILLNTPYESVFICIELPARQDTVTFPLFLLRCIFPLKGHGGQGIRAMLKTPHFISMICFDNLFPSTFLNWMVIKPLSESPPSAQGVPSRSRRSSLDVEEIAACHLFRGRVTLEDPCYLYFSSLKILSRCT